MMYRTGNGTVLATRRCLGGYFCPSGTANPSADDRLLCQAGSMCEVGSSAPLACEPGFFQDQRGNDTCKVCPAGSVCLRNSTIPQPCSRGSYCPSGTRFGGEFLCPNGTYSEATNLTSISECTPCTPGRYCGSAGLTAPSGLCKEGYFCGGGSSVATPFHSSSKPSTYDVSYKGDVYLSVVGNASMNDVCPRGHFCGAGS